ncbi:MAG: hypothetical protein GEU80_06765 [Dehalococcoidia bacterium]|nr:hypothetical protein [Dehalococcoidia bacterium]
MAKRLPLLLFASASALFVIVLALVSVLPSHALADSEATTHRDLPEGALSYRHASTATNGDVLTTSVILFDADDPALAEKLRELAPTVGASPDEIVDAMYRCNPEADPQKAASEFPWWDAVVSSVPAGPVTRTAPSALQTFNCAFGAGGQSVTWVGFGAVPWSSRYRHTSGLEWTDYSDDPCGNPEGCVGVFTSNGGFNPNWKVLWQRWSLLAFPGGHWCTSP